MNAKKKMQADLDQEGFNIKYQEELHIYNEGEKQHKSNLLMAFASIMNGYCSTVMKHQVEETTDYENIVRDVPVELLKRIKQY